MRKLLLPITLLAGAAAGLIRAYEWRWAWGDGARGLMQPNHWLSLLLLGLTFAFAVFVLVGTRGAPKKHEDSWDVPDLPRPAPWLGWAGGAAILALLTGAGLDVREYIAGQTPGEALSGVSTPIFALLSLFAGVAVLIVIRAVARGALSRSYGVYMLAPVFWACFWLVRNIGKYAVDPVPLRFFYDMMGTIFALLSLYAAAGFFYAQARVRRALVYCSLGVFFSMVTLLGPGLYWLLWGGLPANGILHAGELCRFGAALLYLPVILLTVNSEQLTDNS